MVVLGEDLDEQKSEHLATIGTLTTRRNIMYIRYLYFNVLFFYVSFPLQWKCGLHKYDILLFSEITSLIRLYLDYLN